MIKLNVNLIQYINGYTSVCRVLTKSILTGMYVNQYGVRRLSRKEGNVLFKDALNTFYLRL